MKELTFKFYIETNKVKKECYLITQDNTQNFQQIFLFQVLNKTTEFQIQKLIILIENTGSFT